jgi:microcystin-dependent protein
VNPGKSIYLSTTGGALFQSELSSITLSSFRINQPYGFITLTPRLNDGLGNTNYGLMNVYAFPEASPAAYVNTFNTNFGYISTLSTINLAVNQNTLIAGNLTVGGSITYASPGATILDIGRVNTNLLSAATVLNTNFYGVNVGASTINTCTFVVRDSGSVLLPNAGSWSNAASFAGAVDPNSLTLGNPAGSAGVQIGVSSNFFGLRSFSVDGGANKFSTTVVLRDGTVGVNVAGINDVGSLTTSNFPFYVRGAAQLSNLGVNNNIGMLKNGGINTPFVEVSRFGGSVSNYRIDSSSNIAEGFFGPAFTNQYNWLTVDKNGSIKFWTGSAGPTTERITIDNAGRVGIGGVNPTYNLDVSGTTRISGNVGIGRAPGSAALDVSGVIVAVGGSSTVPTYTFLNDLNTGISQPAADTIGFVTNSAERMRIDSAGRVGIGLTPNPSYALDVSGNARIINSGSGSAALDFSAGGGSFSVIRQTGPNGNVDILNYGTGLVSFGNNGIPGRLAIDGAGRVGVNRLDPSYTLDVSGTARVSGNLTVDGTITGTLSVVPTGCIMMWYTNTAPTGWLLCDGSAIPVGNTALIALIGPNTPNMKGRVPVGRDAAQTEFDTLGETGGAKTHTLSEPEIPPHTHGYKFPTSQIAQGGGADVVAEDNFTLALPKTSDSTGGGQAHNNLQPYIVLNYIIKI